MHSHVLLTIRILLHLNSSSVDLLPIYYRLLQLATFFLLGSPHVKILTVYNFLSTVMATVDTKTKTESGITDSDFEPYVSEL